jgi:hypothetical protein
VDPPEIRAQLKKGDQFQARFNLTPEPSRLVVSRQLPGTTVWVDGSLAGSVKPNGLFVGQIAPGDHRIEFRKDGFLNAAVQRSFRPGRQVDISGAEAPLAKVVTTPPPPVNPPPAKPDPTAVEQAEWQRLQGTKSTTQLDDFLKKYPNGIHRNDAQARLKQLQVQQTEAAQEDAAWNATDKSSAASLEQFLNQFGDGAHAQDARNMSRALKRQQQDTVAAAQQAKQQASRGAADSTAVLNALRDFEAAYNQKSLATMQGLWTSMPRTAAEIYRNQFRDAKLLDFRLTPSGQPTITGNEATVICTRSLNFVAKNGQHPREINDRVRVDLARSGSQWTIRSITRF